MQNTQPTFEIDLNFRYLQTELARIDLLIRRQVRLWQLAGQDPTDAFRGLYVSDAEVEGMLSRPLSSSWGQMVELLPDEAALFGEAEAKAEAEIESVKQEAVAQGQVLRLLALASKFNLDRFALDVLLIALAPTLDLRYEKLYAYLQDDVTRKRPSVNLTLDLLGLTGATRLQRLAYFAENAPLRRFQLLEVSGEAHAPLLSHFLRVDPAVAAWLLGKYQPHADLHDQATLYPPAAFEADGLLAEAQRTALTQIAETPNSPVVVFHGADEVGQRLAAQFIAKQLQHPLLAVNLQGLVDGEEILSKQTLRVALRDAHLTGAIPFLTGWDACLSKTDDLSADLMAELITYPNLTIIAGQTRWQAVHNQTQRHFFTLKFPLPAYHHRLTLWQHFLTSNSSSEMTDLPISQSPNLQLPISNLQLPTLSAQFALTTGQIRDAVATAQGLAAQQNEDLTEQHLFTAARTHSNPRLEALARKIKPRYAWDDIILPDDQRRILHEIVETVRGRPVVLEQWGVGRKLASSAAITVLFAGDPGTGKTMAAEVMANELKLDLYKIDLSTVVSKYIGETEKNLEKIFSEAESSNAILFFDEADAIFGKRSEVKDAHDRYANIEVSYLLQRMESYNGVTILATNLRANLDDAFTRRLQFVIDFPFPEPADRLRIWQTLFPPDLPRTDELDFAPLAERFKLAGGNIRNVIVSAAYQAAANGGSVTMKHLLHGVRREMQKMGRLVSEGELKVG
ncbi:MAG: ATP-binding protein [Anaerolineales bacterium]|nr:ATP-binding protein [Anaerolineales bacterium]MCB9107685.1 ATP-binding protein [Anaerolineales bacterium]